jgi:hypothetical protein
MITEQKGQNPIVSAGKSTGFTMEASGKMFKMIMAGLYSDKAKSITREIWSNAFDAHSMAGCPERPFQVSLPSRFNPQFSCRDFGDGLSDEWMNANYVVLGRSSKEDTNDAVGKWGVGRMSPTAYTDTFTVTSVHKGLKTIYNVTVKADGSPDLNTLVPTMKTDEESGVMISFPVDPSDTRLFKDAADTVSLGFEVKPVAEDSSEVDWPSFKSTVTGEGYQFYECAQLSGPYVRMGCVLYPVEVNHLKGGASWASGLNVVVNVPIGAADVTASREDLSYGKDENTVGSLSKIFTGIGHILEEDSLRSISKAKSLYEAMQIYKKASGFLRQKFDAEWDGVELNNPRDRNIVNHSYLSREGWGNSKTTMRSTTSLLGYNVDSVYYYKSKGPDTVLRATSRLRTKAKDLRRSHNMVIAEIPWDKEAKKYDYTHYNDLKRLYGEDIFVDAATLPDEGPVAKTTRKTKVYGLDFSDKEIDLTTGGIYFKSYSGNVQDYRNPLERTINLLTKVGYISANDYVIVPKTHWKKFEGADNWKYGPDVIKEISSNKSAEIIKESSVEFISYDILSLSQFSGGFVGVIKAYYDLYNKGKSSKVGVPEWRDIAYKLDIPLPAIPRGSSDNEEWKKAVYSIYPLLDLIATHHKKQRYDYVKLVDFQNETLTKAKP